MNIQENIQAYISIQTEQKRLDMQALHEQIMSLLPASKLWFEDGRNAEGKVISNPNIGYGSYTIQYANGKTREFFQVGLSANTTGISIYLIGIPDKKALTEKFKSRIGKASITGYCIKFKQLKDLNLEVLKEAILFTVNASGN
ncbi:MAG: hypothetical protein RI922_1748 [Bacteroidota bacterium]|jgi:hypothetical protein